MRYQFGEVGPSSEAVGSERSRDQQLVPIVLKVLVFVRRSGRVDGARHVPSQALDLPAANDAIALLPDGDASTSTQALRLTRSADVAFHNRTLTVWSAASLRGFPAPGLSSADNFDNADARNGRQHSSSGGRDCPTHLHGTAVRFLRSCRIQKHGRLGWSPGGPSRGASVGDSSRYLRHQSSMMLDRPPRVFKPLTVPYNSLCNRYIRITSYVMRPSV